MLGRDHRIARQPVHLGIVEQQEEGAEAADAVVGISAVQLRPVPTLRMQLLERRVRTLAQLVQRAELDRLGRAGLRACGLVPTLQPVVAERALPHPAVFLLAEERGQIGLVTHVRVGGDVPLVEHAERTCGHAVPTAVADVLLHDDRPELRAKERPGRADVETGRVRAVLADVRLHQPAQCSAAVAVRMQRLLLLDERDVTPRVRAECRCVVVGLSGPDLPVLRDEVPLLARDLARFTADADRRVGEEAYAGVLLVAVRVGRCGHAGRLHERAHERVVSACSDSRGGDISRREYAWSRISATKSTSAFPRGRRPGLIPHVAALASWMCTFGSSAMCIRSFALSPLVSSRCPQWYGSPTW